MIEHVRFGQIDWIRRRRYSLLKINSLALHYSHPLLFFNSAYSFFDFTPYPLSSFPVVFPRSTSSSHLSVPKTINCLHYVFRATCIEKKVNCWLKKMRIKVIMSRTPPSWAYSIWWLHRILRERTVTFIWRGDKEIIRI